MLHHYLKVFIFFNFLFVSHTVLGQNFIEDDQLVWCAISEAELSKCNEWSMAIENQILNSQYRGDITPFEFHLRCERGTDRDQCMNKVANNVAQLITLDPGEVFLAGRYYSLVPIMMEKYGQSNEPGYYSVALIRRNSPILSINDLKDKKACFPGVGQLAGWVLPIAKLLDEDIMEVKNCNNIVKTVASFFNSSCAPNSLIDKHNPSGDNPQSVCSLCHGSCSGNEHYSNFDGAMRCLANIGDVAFVKHNTVDLSINQLNHEQQLLGQFATRPKLTRYDFELLCPSGGKAPIDSYHQCNWGFVPANAIVISSSIHPEKRLKIQEFLYNCSSAFSKQSTNTNNFFSTLLNNNRNNKSFELFGSPPVNMYSQEPSYVNLLFSEDTTKLVPIEESRQTFKGYLGEFVHYFEKLKKCPVPLAKLCITSEKELIKCNAMVTAFRAQMLKPQLACVLRNTSVECMQAISEGLADLTVLDGGDIHKAGHLYKLIPIVAEKYNLEDSNYYAVAVAKQSDKDIDLLYLKGKRSCHSGYLTGSGWVMPLNFLISNNRMRSYGCNSVKAAAQFFQKSCVPGALSPHYTQNSWTYGLLCELCHGSSYRFCSRNHAEPFYGNTGALRCLVEGGGDVAFVRHTTILENTSGKNQMLAWSRNIIPSDFELLCRDGSRAQFNEYKTCNLGKIPANAIVTSEYKPIQHIDSYVNLFIIAQELYGSKYSEDYKFKMFVSPTESGYSDLIFQDSTSSLVAIPESKRNYQQYLGAEFMRAIRNVDCASSSLDHSLSIFILNLIFVLNCLILFT